MAKAKTLLGLAAACAACCAVPLAFPALLAASAGIGLTGIGAVLSSGWPTAAGLALIAAAVFLLRRRSARRCSASPSAAR